MNNLLKGLMAMSGLVSHLGIAATKTKTKSESGVTKNV